MNKKSQKRLLYSLLIGVILIGVLFLIFITALQITTFSNSLSAENLTFTGNQNITRNLSISKFVNFTSATMNLSGYNSSLILAVNSSAFGIWSASDRGYAGMIVIINSSNITVSRIDKFNSQNANECAIFNSTGGVLAWSGTFSGNNCSLTPTNLLANTIYYFLIKQGEWVPAYRADVINNSYFTVLNGTGSDLAINTSKSTHGIINIKIDNVIFPNNISLSINNTQIWNFIGIFNQTSNKTSDFSSILNLAINNRKCDCVGCQLIGNNCTLNFTFHSDTAGILQYSDIQINYNQGISIVSPIEGQIFTQDSPTTLFNITNDTAFDVCYAELDSIKNYTIPYNGNNVWNWTNTSMVDGSHNVTYWCNQSISGTWRTSDTINFEIDSVNITRCRNLNVNRSYTLLNNISSSSTCLSFLNNSITLNGGGYLINNTLISYNNTRIINSKLTNISISSNSINNTLINTTLILESVSTGANLTRKWYFQTQVNKSDGYFSGVYVEFFDKAGALLPDYTDYTDAQGSIGRKEVIEYVNNGGVKTYSTPHTINVSYVGYITNSTVYNLTTKQNIFHYVTLGASNTAPTSTLITPTNNSYQKSPVTFNCSATDSEGLKNVTLYIYNNAGSLNLTNSTTFTGTSNSTTFSHSLSDATYKWNCLVYDNATTSLLDWYDSNFTLNVDTTNPLISYGVNTAVNYANLSQNFIYINTSWTEINFKNITFNLYNSTWNNVTTYTTATYLINFTNIANGKYWYYVNITDKANNKNSTAIYNITLDTIKPNINIVFPTNNSNLSYNTVNVNYTRSDVNLASCWYSNDTMSVNTTLTGCTNITGIIWAEGQHNVTIWANDSANNVNSSFVRFFVDTIYPTISYGTGTENNNTNFSRNWIYINTTWTELNFKNITFTLKNDTGTVNTTTYTTATYLINFTNLVDANYTYYVNITDIAGNSNSTGIRRILIDDTPPVVDIVYPLDGGTYSFNNISINYTVSDNLIGLSSCWYTNNSGVNNYSITCGQNFTQNLSEGNYTYTIYANDTLNNIGSHSHTFGISTTAPAIILNAPDNNQWFNNGINVYFNFTATDSNGLSTCRLWANWTGTWAINFTWVAPTNATMNFTTRNLTDGYYNWNVWCNDTLNNGAFSTSNRTVNIDTTFPLISYGTGIAVNYANLSQSNIFVNVTFTETNFANITYNLYNDAGSVSIVTYTTPTYFINWTSVPNANYTYEVNITDIANNKNSTAIRYITLDNTNPSATLLSPADVSYNASGSINFTASLTDNLGIKNATLVIYNETGEENKTTKTFGSYVTTYTLGIVVTVIEGIKNWWYDVYDWAGNYFKTGDYTLTVDTTYPNVLASHYSPTTIYTETDVIVYGNISDINLDTVWLRINFTGTYQNITVTNKVGNTYNYTIVSTVIENFENISWYWYANDSANNVNFTSQNSFLVTNRNPYNVNITRPINNSFINTNWIWVNFTSSDTDGDTLNYSLYNSTDGTTYSYFSSTTNNYLNFSNYNLTEGKKHYLYVTANDSQLQNSSISNITFTIDTTNPNINTIDSPFYLSVPIPTCPTTPISLNYSVSDTNLNYCSYEVTVGGSTSVPLANITNCLNTTFNVLITGTSVQVLTLKVYDLAGNSNSTQYFLYINPSACPAPYVPPGGGSGGGPPYIPPGNRTSCCGDGICQRNETESCFKEAFWDCYQDCGGEFTLPTLFCNPFATNQTETEQCIWSSSNPLRFIFYLIAGILVITLLFKVERPDGKYKIKFRPYQYVKKRRKKYG